MAIEKEPAQGLGVATQAVEPEPAGDVLQLESAAVVADRQAPLVLVVQRDLDACRRAVLDRVRDRLAADVDQCVGGLLVGLGSCRGRELDGDRDVPRGHPDALLEQLHHRGGAALGEAVEDRPGPGQGTFAGGDGVLCVPGCQRWISRDRTSPRQREGDVLHDQVMKLGCDTAAFLSEACLNGELALE